MAGALKETHSIHASRRQLGNHRPSRGLEQLTWCTLGSGEDFLGKEVDCWLGLVECIEFREAGGGSFQVGDQ